MAFVAAAQAWRRESGWFAARWLVVLVARRGRALRWALAGAAAAGLAILLVPVALAFVLLTVFMDVEAPQPANCRLAQADGAETPGGDWLSVATSTYSAGGGPSLWDVYPAEVLAGFGTLTTRWGASQPVSGRVPPDMLQALSWAPGHRLHPAAAAGLEALNVAWRAEHGASLPVTSSYRDYAGQVACLGSSRGALCANPAGTSNHGWGMAVDLGGGINSFGTAQHEWMRANGAAFGWFHPDWAGRGGSKPEPWHWEFLPLGDIVCGAAPDVEANRALAEVIAAEFGWADVWAEECGAGGACARVLVVGDWSALDALGEAASGWDHTRRDTENLCDAGGAQGVTYGIPARCGADHWYETDAEMMAWLASPRLQIEWMLERVRDLHGTPTAALAHFHREGWF